MRIEKLFLNIITLSCMGLLLVVSCLPLSPPISVVLVTPTQIHESTHAPSPTSTLPPTPTIYTVTSIIFTTTLTPTLPYPLLRIEGWKIIRVNCKKDKADNAIIELVIAGGLLPYFYNTNISVDEHGIAHAVVTSTDKQFATVDIPISKGCGGSSGATDFVGPSPVLTTPPVVITTPPVVITTPPVVITTPAVVITTPPSPPTNTPDFPQKECNDNYDNDGDGRIDYPDDPNCTGRNDNNEGG